MSIFKGTAPVREILIHFSTEMSARTSGLGSWSLFLQPAGCGFDSRRHPVCDPPHHWGFGDCCLI